MKTCLLLVAFSLAAASSRADLTIVQTVEGLGQTATRSVTKYKDGKTRMDVAPDSTIIMDAETGDTISLLHAQKRYLKAPAEVVRAAVENLNGTLPKPSEAKPALVATGKKETVAGYPAEEYTATVAGAKIALWLTTAFPEYEKVKRELGAAFREGPLAAMAQNFGLDLANLPGFPVRQINELQPGQTVTATLVSVSSAPIPDGEFEIPAGYEAIATPELTPRAAMPERQPITP